MSACAAKTRLKRARKMIAMKLATRLISTSWLGLVSVAPAWGAPQTPMFRFDFGSGPLAPGYVQVTPRSLYSKVAGFGFENAAAISAIDRGGPDALRRDFCSSDKPFYFSVDVPEGNYNVTVTLGDADEATATTIKAEARRLMLQNVRTAPGKFETRTFSVAVKRPTLKSGEMVRLKGGELGSRDWDERLTLEFNDARPALCALEISKADDALTVYLAGDSTVTDQAEEP